MFLISAQKHMLWVLIRSASIRYRNKKNINTFLLKKCALKVIYLVIPSVYLLVLAMIF